MRQTKIVFLIYCFLFSELSFGQRSTSDIGFQEYYNLLIQKKVDTLIIYRWGCVGCDRKYDSTSKSTAKGEVIYVLTTHNGISEIATFDHYSMTQDTVEASLVFRSIKKNHKKLLLKEPYQTLISKTDVLINNTEIPFMFEIFEVHLPSFKFSSEVLIDKNDKMEANTMNKKWYKATQEIAELLLKCLPIRPEE